MIPYASNNQSENCSPISSNCVIWQGPNLPCINLCKGDSVSDVVYKMAEELCTLKDSIGLTDIDLQCLLQVCQTTPEPTKTLANILQLLVDKVCCLSDIVNNIPDPGTPYVEPTLNLPACLQYSNGVGGSVTQLVLSQYVLRIATFLCVLDQTVTTNNTATIQALSSLNTRVTILENATPAQFSSCLLGVLADVETVVPQLESEFCDYKTILGLTNELNTAIGRQCLNLNTENQLAKGKGYTMPMLTGWNTTVQTVADSLSNLWLTVCDIRSAIKIIQSSCCKVDCNSITIAFDYKWIDEYTLRVYFAAKTTLPLGFWDCDDTQGNMFTFTDALGNSYPVYIHFRREDPTDLTGVLDDTTVITNGYDIDLSHSFLNTTGGLTMSSVNLCFTNGDVSCVKCFDKTIAPYTGGCCTITSSVSNLIMYKVCYSETTTTTTTGIIQ